MPSVYQSDYFNEMKEWSDRKLRLLERYVAAFVKILGSHHGEVCYVDGFAGRGVYDDDVKTKGSPVRVADLSAEYARSNKPYSLRCINIEAHPDSFANLEIATAEYGRSVVNLLGTFGDNVDRVVAEVGGQPTICFLDPFGVKGIDLECVAKIVNRNAATDLWIRFDPQIVRRLDGFFDSGDATANKKFGILPGIYGIKDREDLHSRLAGSTPDDRLNNALILYMERLVGLYKKARGAGFVGAYAIRSLSEQVKYHLVLQLDIHGG